MHRMKSESDDDEYVPSGFLNNTAQALNNRDIKVEGICEFYNSSEPVNVVPAKPCEDSQMMTDLSFDAPASSVTLTPTSHHQPPTVQPKMVIPRSKASSSARGPVQGATIIQRSLNVPHSIHARPIRRTPLPYSPMIRVPTRSVIYQQRSFPYANPGFPMYHAPATPHSQVYPPHYLNLNTAVPPLASGMMLVSNMPQVQPTCPDSQKMKHDTMLVPKVNVEARISAETRKQRQMEVAAKAKLEREARRALMREKRKADAIARNKAKKDRRLGQNTSKKRKCFFSKDMFAIRLKDVDSVDRNDEIWRVDNHILIQKFCSIPSIRAPSKQFQSTNKLAGYDSRAIWRFFILDPANVEIDKYGSKVTIHNFPSIESLRKAKKEADIKDDEFKKVEISELEEKAHKFEAKQVSRTEERMKNRVARKQKRQAQKMTEKRIRYIAESIVCKDQKDDEVCRSVVHGILDALDDDEYDDGDSLSSGSEMSYSEDDYYDDDDDDDEDDAGSLITLLHSSDSEEEDLNLQFDDNDIRFELYGEDEVPKVALELIVD